MVYTTEIIRLVSKINTFLGKWPTFLHCTYNLIILSNMLFKFCKCNMIEYTSILIWFIYLSVWLAQICCGLFKQAFFWIVFNVECFSLTTLSGFVSIMSIIIWCVELFEFLLNCSSLSCSVSSAPPPSEPGRRWLRSHPQQQVLCFQDCQQRQFLSLPYQRQESHIQRSGGFTPKPWYWPRPQQISDLTGNCNFFM